MTLLFIDTETGGTDSHTHSLLQVGLGALRERRIDDSPAVRGFYVREDPVRISPEAERIHGISESIVTEKGILPAAAARATIRFIQNHIDAVSGRVTPVGWNIGFDMSFMRRLWRISDMADYLERFNATFSHRTLDLQSIVQYRVMRGLLPNIESLNDALNHFGITRTKAHDAVADISATMELYQALRDSESQGICSPTITGQVIGVSMNDERPELADLTVRTENKLAHTASLLGQTVSLKSAS